MSKPNSIAAFVLALPALLPLGCITEGAPKPSPKAKPAVTSKAPPASFLVTPLTRIGFDQKGEPSVFLYVDFRDSAGSSVKAFGVLHVELFRGSSAPGADGKPPAPSLIWEADLRDPVRNALTFDEMITHTYTITLNLISKDATPEARAEAEKILHWARKEGSEAEMPAPTLVAQFAPTEGGQVLKATYTLTR